MKIGIMDISTSLFSNKLIFFNLKCIIKLLNSFFHDFDFIWTNTPGIHGPLPLLELSPGPDLDLDLDPDPGLGLDLGLGPDLDPGPGQGPDPSPEVVAGLFSLQLCSHYYVRLVKITFLCSLSHV